MVLCYRCGRYGHIAPHCESERRRRSDEFYDSPGSWSDQESSESSESDEWDDFKDPVTPLAVTKSLNASGVYVIVLDNGTRYVGKSANVNRRIFQHLNPSPLRGSSLSGKTHLTSLSPPSEVKRVAWCKKGGTRRAYSEPTITEPNADLSVWEQNETIAQMIKHGCDRVRGWEFTSCQPFGNLEYELFKKLAFSGDDLCRTCGYKGHMAEDCYAQHKAPWLEATLPTP